MCNPGIVTLKADNLYTFIILMGERPNPTLDWDNIKKWKGETGMEYIEDEKGNHSYIPNTPIGRITITGLMLDK